VEPATGGRAAALRDVALVAAAFAALAAVMTSPVLLQADRALPGELGDPLLNTFILGWDADRLRHGFSGLWTAPFFFPLQDTLAFSEHLLGIAVFTSLAVWATGNPVLAYNLAFLASYVLAGVGMYLLAASLWQRRDAAWLAALAFAFAPHRVMHVTHLQVLMSGWMPLSLWGLHRYFATGSRTSLAVFAAAFALLGLSNGYFLYFFSIVMVPVLAAEMWRAAVPGSPGRHLRLPWPEARDLLLAAAAILVTLSPVGLSYLRARGAFHHHRAVDEMVSFGARWSDYLRIPSGLRVWSGVLQVGEGERMLFPGLMVVALAALALVTARRGAWAGNPLRPPRWSLHVWTYAAVLGLALWLSAGPSGPGPYRLLLLALPGFDGLRVPARFVVVVALALGVLSSAGAAWLLSRLRPRAASVIAVLLAAAIALEGYGGPLKLAPFRHDQPVRSDLNAWLRDGPRGGVLELPIAGPILEPFTLVYQYNTLLHGRPVVNGYSGYGYAMQDFLGGPGSPLRDPEALPGMLEGLRAVGVRHVVLHQSTFVERPDLGWPDPKILVDAIDHAAGTIGRQFNDAVVWRLDAARPRMPVDEAALAEVPIDASMMAASVMPERLRFAVDGDLRTNWRTGAPQEGTEWVRLAFTRDIDVGRLVILTSPYGVGDHPRRIEVESESADGSPMTLYSGSFLPFLMRGLAGPVTGAPAVIDLPSNACRALRMRQTGHSATWQWAIHELRVFERIRPR